MPAAAPIALAGASLGGALISSSASKKAANAQAAAAAQDAAVQREGIQLQRDIYNQNRSDLAPWREAGAATLRDLVAQLPALTAAPDASQFRADPGYQFSVDQGMRSINRQASAQGRRLSGGTLQELMRYGQGMADQQYGTWYDRQRALQGDKFNRLAAIAGVGQSATTTTGQMGQNMAGNVQQGLANIGQAYQSAGNARASGYIGQANAINGALNNVSSLALMGGFGGGGGFNPYAAGYQFGPAG